MHLEKEQAAGANSFIQKFHRMYIRRSQSPPRTKECQMYEPLFSYWNSNNDCVLIIVTWSG